MEVQKSMGHVYQVHLHTVATDTQTDAARSIAVWRVEITLGLALQNYTESNVNKTVSHIQPSIRVTIKLVI